MGFAGLFVLKICYMNSSPSRPNYVMGFVFFHKVNCLTDSGKESGIGWLSSYSGFDRFCSLYANVFGKKKLMAISS